MKLKPYPAYRDSGVPWLGEIPARWEVWPLKYRVTMNSDVLPENTAPNFEFRYVDIGSVDSTGRIHQTEPMVFENAPSRARRRGLPGDTIISTVRTYLKAIAYLGPDAQEMVMSTGFAILRSKPSVAPKFLWHSVQSEPFIQSVIAHSEGVGYPAINPSTLGRLVLFVPPEQEQHAIVAFLDRETARIDALVAKKERLIDLLREQRTALITRAVTKGLDPTAPLKDSGVEWLGEIPAHWEVRRFRFAVLGSITNGVFKKKDDYGSGLPLINVSDVYRDDFMVSFEKLERVRCDETELARYKVQEGDVFFVRSSLKLEGVGKAASCSAPIEPSVFECHLVRARPNADIINYRYLITFLNSIYARDFLTAHANTVTMSTIDQAKIKDIQLPLPSLKVQDEVMTCLDRAMARIDALMEKTRRSIELLREKRAALITAAVTGKTDVRGVAI